MSPPPPDTLVAELTHACPLRCPYCSNPVEAVPGTLSTEAWSRAIVEAARLGVLQLHLTGGEPLLRRDLEMLVRVARREDLYVNLITSGVPLTAARLFCLRAAGLDHVQLSFQAADAAAAAPIAGRDVHAHKREVARAVRALGMALTINVVLHRSNIDSIDALIVLAEELGAQRVELAPTQYLGHAFANREALLPTVAQMARARARAEAARVRLRGTLDVAFVLPDLHEGRPRACMSGWGRRYLVIAPDGLVLPCQAARVLPGLRFVRVGEQPLDEIWSTSEAFVAFRGEDWMEPPCRSCESRGVDFAGCRCQAFLLTGRAGAPDPACARAPAHPIIVALRR